MVVIEMILVKMTNTQFLYILLFLFLLAYSSMVTADGNTYIDKVIINGDQNVIGNRNNNNWNSSKGRIITDYSTLNPRDKQPLKNQQNKIDTTDIEAMKEKRRQDHQLWNNLFNGLYEN